MELQLAPPRIEPIESAQEATQYLRQFLEANPVASCKPVSAWYADRAIELADSAWDEHDEAKSKTLARRALELDPLCAEAHLVLYEWADSYEKGKPHAQDALIAAERSLPAYYFNHPDYVGSFWLRPETRTYMVARRRFAKACYETGELEQACGHLQAMLNLNPNDNQGVRDQLVFWLIEANRDTEASALMQRYKGDFGATFPYASALLSYRRFGAGGESDQLLEKALRSNPHVPRVLTQDECPQSPDCYIVGEESEATMIALSMHVALAQTAGAADWIFDVMQRLLRQEREKARRRQSFKPLKRGDYSVSMD